MQDFALVQFAKTPLDFKRVQVESASKLLVVFSLLFVSASFTTSDAIPKAYLIGASVVCLFGWLAQELFRHREKRDFVKHLKDLSSTIEHDEKKHYLVDQDGSILFQNAAARSAGDVNLNLEEVLRPYVADTHRVISSLTGQAVAGRSFHNLVSRNGSAEVEVRGVSEGVFLWSLENTRLPQTENVEATTQVPMVSVGPKDEIFYVSEGASNLIGENVETLGDLGVGEIEFGAFNSIRTKVGNLPCFVQSVSASPTQRNIFIFPVGPERTELTSLPFEDLPVAAMRIRKNGEILIANQAARKLINCEKCSGLFINQLLEGLGRPISDWLDEAAEGRLQNPSEFLRLRNDASESYVQVTIGPASSSNDDHLNAVLSDATELKTLEAQFVQSQKMQAIGQLAGGIAHDFNNLLTAILGHCDLMLLRHDTGDEDFSDLTQINQNANRAASLVGQLLAFSRKQTLQPEVSDLRLAMSDLSHLLNRLVGESYQIDVIHRDDDASIRVDRQQFEQVVMNLVVNARDAMEDGGRITIEVSCETITETTRKDRAKIPVGQYVMVAVKDTGTGIPEQSLKKIFEPFYTTKPQGEGTGLGLSTVYGIVKQSGGFVFAESEIGVGSCFSLMFPKVEAVSTRKVHETSDLPMELKPVSGGAVLLVEDEAPVRAFAARALRIKGLTVIEAGSGSEALEVLDRQDLEVDVIVSDVIMPGCDGPSWVKQARNVLPEVPVIFMSGYADEEFTEKCLALSNSSFIQKPFSLVEFTAEVDQQLNRAAQGMV